MLQNNIPLVGQGLEIHLFERVAHMQELPLSPPNPGHVGGVGGELGVVLASHV